MHAQEAGIGAEWLRQDEPGGAPVSLPERIDAEQAQVSRYESGRAVPSLATVVRLAEAFGVCTDYLLVDDAPRRPFRSAEDALGDQLATVADVLRPTYEALEHYVLQAPIVGADETWWRLMERPVAKRWWVWSVTREDAVVYRILEHRSQDAAREVLAGFTGIVMADGYGAYAALARAGPGITLAHCWAHVRRKFIEAAAHYPEPCRSVLDLIGQLYAVEREAPSLPAMGGENEAMRDELLAQRRRLRDERSRSIVRAIQTWALAQRALPASSLGKAIGYLLGLWRGLTRFLDDPCIPLDNNRTERGLRGVVLGRKNHYGSRSRRGLDVAALFYSLIESAKLCGVEPKRYLLTATRAGLADRTAVTLPHASSQASESGGCHRALRVPG